jgi:hypothetical protein
MWMMDVSSSRTEDRIACLFAGQKGTGNNYSSPAAKGG